MLKTDKARLKTPYSAIEKYLMIIALLKNPKNIEIIVPTKTIPVPLAIFCKLCLSHSFGFHLGKIKIFFNINVIQVYFIKFFSFKNINAL